MRAAKLKKRTPRSIFAPGMVEGRWSRYDAWIREVLFLYMRYREITTPMLSADGQPVVDTFGRPKPALDAEKEMHGVKKGAVWFTRETLRAAWFIVFEQDANRVDQSNHYAKTARHRHTSEADLIAGRTNVRVYTNYSHPMDAHITRMVRDGRLIRKSQGRYMVSKGECARVELKEVWDLHLQRGFKWEGLTYTEQQVPAALVDRGTRKVRNSSTLTFQTPHSSIEGKRHPNALGWDAIYAELESYLFFDRWDVHRIARKLDVITEAQGMASVTTHMVRWTASGKITKVLPKLYQSKDFAPWFRDKKTEWQKPIVPDTSSWIVEWLSYWSRMQVRMGQSSYFTSDTIFSHFTWSDDSSVQEWMATHYPDGLHLRSIARMLTHYKEQGYIVKHTHVGFRASAAVVDLFAPLWLTPSELHSVIEMTKEVVRVTTLPLVDAIGEVTKRSSSEVVYRIIDRINELPGAETYELFNTLSKQIDMSPSAMLNGYREARGTMTS